MTPAPDPVTAAPATPAREVEQVFARQPSAPPGLEPKPPLASTTAPSYRVSDPTAAVAGGDSGAFFDHGYTVTLSAMIDHVIEREGPVLDTILARRIARAHGWLRTGARIRERVLQLAQSKYRTSKEDVGTFYWPSHLAPAAEFPFRPPADDDSVRPADEVSLPELVSLAREVAGRGIQGEEAFHAMARALGLQQLRAANRARFEKAMSVVLAG